MKTTFTTLLAFILSTSFSFASIRIEGQIIEYVGDLSGTGVQDAFGDVFGLYSQSGTGGTFTVTIDIDPTAELFLGIDYVDAITSYTFANDPNAVTPYTFTYDVGSILTTDGTGEIWDFVPDASPVSSTGSIGGYSIPTSGSNPRSILLQDIDPAVTPTSTIPSEEDLISGLANFSSDTSLFAISFENGSGDVITVTGEITAVVPEPSHYATIGGLLALAFVVIRRRNTR